MKDDELRERYQEALRYQREADREGCPDPETMRRVLERELPEPDRLRHLDHIMACGDCVRDFELLQSVAGTFPRPMVRRRPWLAAAAIVVMASAGWWWIQIDQRSGPDTPRGVGSNWQVVPEDGATISLPALFVWHRVPDARMYTVELIDAAGLVAAMLETADTTARFENTASTSSGEYTWWVIATLPGGRQVRGTPLRLRLQPQ